MTTRKQKRIERAAVIKKAVVMLETIPGIDGVALELACELNAIELKEAEVWSHIFEYADSPRFSILEAAAEIRKKVK